MLKTNSTITGAPGSLLHPQPVVSWQHYARLTRLIRRLAAGTGLLLMVVVALQLVYPANRTLPRANYGGIGLSAVPEEELLARLQAIDDKRFMAKTDTRVYEQSLADIGVSLDTAKIAQELADYPLSARLIPFSALLYESKVTQNHLIVSDRNKFEAFAAKVAKENNSQPIEGSIANKDGKITVTNSKDGKNYRSEDIASYFSAYTHESLAAEARLPHSAVPAVNTYAYLDTVAEQARAMMKTKHVVSAGPKSYVILPEAVARSIYFPIAADKKVTLAIDAGILAAGLEPAADGVFMTPSAGAAGHELDRLATAQAAAAAIQAGAATIPAALKPLAPTAAKMYPATSNGLHQLITDWKLSHASLRPAVTFAEIGGYGRHAEVDGDVSYFSASVYKVFPAWYALKQIDEGELDPAGPIAGGFNLTNCFHNMIIISDSKCSEAIVTKYGGWPAMDGLARDHGIEGITLANGVTVTTNGMTSFLHKLENGELLSADRTAYLLDTMKRQKYRTGIPAGSAGEVADKVGYQPKTRSWHDAAIVYHPNGKYTLVILTHQGASLPVLATLARQISDTLSR